MKGREKEQSEGGEEMVCEGAEPSQTARETIDNQALTKEPTKSNHRTTPT